MKSTIRCYFLMLLELVKNPSSALRLRKMGLTWAGRVYHVDADPFFYFWLLNGFDMLDLLTINERFFPKMRAYN